MGREMVMVDLSYNCFGEECCAAEFGVQVQMKVKEVGAATGLCFRAANGPCESAVSVSRGVFVVVVVVMRLLC